MLKNELKSTFAKAKFNEHSTQIYLLNERDEVLLFRRARGMGVGVISAPGGKLDAGESAEDGAIREMQEETGLTVAPQDLEFMGKLYVHLSDDDYWVNGDIFRAKRWGGKMVSKTDEGEPFWVSIHSLPWEQMWGDERLWLSAGLAGARFCAYVIVRKGKIAEHFGRLITYRYQNSEP